jgi:uncharacterized protein
MPAYSTPGVYFERADAVVPAITALRTDIAGFVGIAERGPLHLATPVESWRQFQAIFGNFIGGGYLAYVVKGFFENGGRRCYVVRVADRETAASAVAELRDADGKVAWRIEASSPGVWGNQLAVSLRTTHRAQTLTVVEPGAPVLSSSPVASVTNFARGTLVRLFQAGAAVMNVLRVVNRVDGEHQRLEWTQPLPATLDFTQPVFVESIEYTLTVFWRGRGAAIYENLSLVPEHERYAPNVVRLWPLERSDAREDILPPPPPLVIVAPETAPGVSFGPPNSLNHLALDSTLPELLSGGTDGLATLAVDDFIGEPEDLLASDVARYSRQRGLRVLEIVDEVSVVAVPDIHIRPELPAQTATPPPDEWDECACGPREESPVTPPVFPELPSTFSDAEIFRVQNALVAHCEGLKDRFALLDPPFSTARDNKLGISAVLAWRSRFESKYAALYFSWLRVMDPLRLGGKVVRAIPSSGHVAGIFARSDLEVGVHKAPANAEVRWAEDTTVLVEDDLQASLNPQGVNAIRCFPGRGLRLYGARTVSSDPDWRCVNVRRLMLMIEEALDVATQWVVFEPNDVYTRNKVTLAITTFLETLWQRGALAGAQPDEAFYIKCDEDNNPSYERDQGRLHVEVGVAPSIPAEFIILRLGRTAEEFEITEA